MAKPSLFSVKRLFAFRGRATRREYFGMLGAVYALTALLLMSMDSDIGRTTGNQAHDVVARASLIALLAFSLLSLVIMLAVGVRRVHDHDKPGLILLITLIPVFGWIYSLILFLMPGSEGWNSYGPNPRLDADIEALREIF